MSIFCHFERHFVIATDETLYPLTLFDVLGVILCIALLSFLSKIFMVLFEVEICISLAFQETVGSHLFRRRFDGGDSTLVEVECTHSKNLSKKSWLYTSVENNFLNCSKRSRDPSDCATKGKHGDSFSAA